MFSDYISLGLIRDLEMLAYNNECVLWIRNLEYNQQLYVSATYNTIFPSSALLLYEDPTSWKNASINAQELDEELRKKRRLICPDYTALYCIFSPDGKEQWIQDRSFHLPTNATEQKLIVGCALPTLNKEMLTTHQGEINSKLDVVITEYYKILTKSHIPTSSNQAKNLDEFELLSKREKQVFKLFIQGKTAAQVAQIIHLSPRTVESYVINLKLKLNCENKSDLIMKAIDNGWLLLNL